MKIIADINIPYLKGVVEHYGNVTYLEGKQFTKENIKEADTLIVRTVVRLDESILKDSNVKLICSATIGYDHIDTEYCEKNNIKWTNAPGCNSGSVQQYIVSVLYRLAEKHDFDLKGKTIGIVGVGNVGKKVAEVCTLLGMNVLLNDPPREKREGSSEFCSLDTIKKESDIISFHTPLVRAGDNPTLHLANDSFFYSLKKEPYIINSARGSIIDTKAIKEAYKKKYISGVVVDCWENEPNIDLEYLAIADVATPHIAGYSADGKSNATKMALTSLADFWNLSKDPIKKIIIPSISNTEIAYNNLGDDKIKKSVLKTYDPLIDDNLLRSNIENFSKLRTSYRLRREYFAYTLINAIKSEDLDLLKRLGFNYSIKEKK